jgi:RNA polymerase sigma factor (sigma-70 family)
MNGDLDLLHQYTRDNSQDAFTALVNRHVNLVYSAALRQVRSPQLAEEIAQSVFADLARNAGSLARGGNAPSSGSLTPWLYAVTRRTAIDAIRKESRRRLREQIAVEMNEMNATANDWTQIAPLLDDAMTALEEIDRTAVLLRYFENKSLREVGEALGASEDAAQKRVSRAVEKLREFFSKRNVTVGAAGLTVLISANAVQSAPVGLAVAISAAALAGTAVSASTVIAATKTIAMTTIQKTIIGATLAAAVGTGVFEAHQASQLREQNQTLQQQQAPLAEQIRRLSEERDDALKRLALLSARPTPHRPAPIIHIVAGTNAPAQYADPTNLYARFKDKMPKLTPAQVEAYLKDYRTNAATLLAAYRTSGDPALLQEAMQNYPNDPQVAFAAVFDKDLSPEQQRQWLNAFEQSAPDNALANYLSALNYFNSGEIDQGLQELTAASGKPLNDYDLNSVQADEEAYLSAGYSAAEAGLISTSGLVLPQVSQEKKLGQDLVDLANAYSQSGDQASAQAVLQMTMNIGQNVASQSSSVGYINQLVGVAIEKFALNAMNPNTSYGDNGQTVQDQLNQIAQNRAATSGLIQQAQSLMTQMSDQDWINYDNRRMVFGEVAADQWLVSKYGQ